MFFVSKKKYQELQNFYSLIKGENLLVKDLLTQKEKELLLVKDLLTQKEKELLEKDKILYSSERKKVILDLQEALNLIRSYQRSLSIVGASDPNIIAANTLLTKYGMRGDPHASYLGAKNIQDQWMKEEEKWGDEAYGTSHIRIDVQAIDEGNEKEPGYTRANVKFVNLNEDNDLQINDTLGI